MPRRHLSSLNILRMSNMPLVVIAVTMHVLYPKRTSSLASNRRFSLPVKHLQRSSHIVISTLGRLVQGNWREVINQLYTTSPLWACYVIAPYVQPQRTC
jgi:hypothetical protein